VAWNKFTAIKPDLKTIQIQALYFFFPLIPVSSEISDFTPYAHAQSNILRIKYVEKIDD